MSSEWSETEAGSLPEPMSHMEEEEEEEEEVQFGIGSPLSFDWDC